MFSINAVAQECNAEFEYSVNTRNDGGYDLSITCGIRSFLPVTAEGFFPKKISYYHLSALGKGKDLTYRNHDGYYYSLSEVTTDKIACDLGYVWVDKERKNIYLNLYWLSTPDGLRPSAINGKYPIHPQLREEPTY